MPKTRIPSSARSQGGPTTPRRHPRGSRSVGSPARSNTSCRLTTVIQNHKEKNDSFVLSPLPSRRSLLTDTTDIGEPRRKSWWKKLDDNSRDVMAVLENHVAVVNNVVEELDVEFLGQEQKNYVLDLPESSDSESISSIVIPQRKLFTNKHIQPQYGQLIGHRDFTTKPHKTNIENEKTINPGPKILFGQSTKLRTKPVFPADLLNLSPDKTVNKTKETVRTEVPIRSLFGNRPAVKRKYMFTDFIASESEDSIPEIQPRGFGFQKKAKQADEKMSTVCVNSAGHGVREPSPTDSMTRLLDISGEWKLLPSSTLVQGMEVDDSDSGDDLGILAYSDDEPANNTIEENVNIQNKQENGNQKKIINESTETRDKNQEVENEEQDDKNDEEDPEHNVDKEKVEDEQNVSQESQEQQDIQKQKTDSVELNESENQELENVEDNEEDLKLDVDEKESEANLDIQNVRQESQEEPNIQEQETDGQELINGSDDICDENQEAEHEEQDKENEENPEINEDTEEVENEKQDDKNGDKDSEHNVDEEKVEDEQNVSQESEEQQDIQKQKTDSEELNESENQEVENVDDNEEGLKLDVDVKESEENLDVQNVRQDSQEESNIQEQETDGQEPLNGSDEICDENQEPEHEEQDKENEEEDPELNKDTEEVENKEQDDKNGEEELKHNVDEEKVEDEQNVSQESQKDLNIQEQETDGQEPINESDEICDDNQEAEHEEQDEENEEEDPELNENTEEQDIQEQATDDQAMENESDEIHDENQEAESADQDEEDDEDDQELNEETEEEEDENPEMQNVSQDSHETDDQDDEIEEQNESQLTDNESQEEGEAQFRSDENEKVDNDEADEINQTDQETPNHTHDTTGRNRKKDKTIVKTPEAILRDRSNQINSFTAQGRNTSIRKTKSMIKDLNIRPSLAPVRESTGFSDGTKNSSAEGSCWDSHRVTKKTLRQTFGKDFTPRKSLRALVMEKSAKRHTEFNDVNMDTIDMPRANSTEYPDASNRYDDIENEENVHGMSKKMKQTTLEMCLQKIKKETIEKRKKMEEEIRTKFKMPPSDPTHLFRMPARPALVKQRNKKIAENKPNAKKPKSMIPLELPEELLEDMKYKPPQRFKPRNAGWVTKRLYKYFETKLEPKYDYKARVRAEKLVETIYNFTKDIRRHHVAPASSVELLKHEMARLNIVKTHHEFYCFIHEFMPREVRVKVVPDIVNKIPLPRLGPFSDILS